MWRGLSGCVENLRISRMENRALMQRTEQLEDGIIRDMVKLSTLDARISRGWEVSVVTSVRNQLCCLYAN